MKTKDIAVQYNIDKSEFESFLYRHKQELKYSDGLVNVMVDDENVAKYVTMFMDEKQKEKAAAQAKQDEARKRAQDIAQQEAEKRKCMAEMLISSGFSFDGYTIVKYSGYISGDDATQIPRSGVFGGNNGSNLTNALVKIRRQALMELKEAAYNLGCNAVVGVDFDYITLEPETANINGGTLYEPYIICVTANGNAVVIEKE